VRSEADVERVSPSMPDMRVWFVDYCPEAVKLEQEIYFVRSEALQEH
jgi:hypothetical protein